jgi:hypothetical protein
MLSDACKRKRRKITTILWLESNNFLRQGLFDLMTERMLGKRIVPYQNFSLPVPYQLQISNIPL